MVNEKRKDGRNICNTHKTQQVSNISVLYILHATALKANQSFGLHETIRLKVKLQCDLHCINISNSICIQQIKLKHCN